LRAGISIKQMFSHIHQRKVSHLIEAEIKKAIFNHRFKVGDKLPPERQLSEEFKSSRSSVREAFRLLEKSGIVEIRKGVHGGAYVKKTDAMPVVDSLKDLLHLEQISLEEIRQVRLMLEPPIAAEAARNATPRDIERLEEANRALEEGYKSGDPAVENNPAIHRVFAEASKNRLCVLLMTALMDIHAYRMRNNKLDEGAKKKIIRHHNKIIESIRNKDAKMAHESMETHILEVHKIHAEIEKKNG
jgi:GntR family transcriptional repressor for pyruvate dehydrogenase complex